MLRVNAKDIGRRRLEERREVEKSILLYQESRKAEKAEATNEDDVVVMEVEVVDLT
jgi:hypothetical protein